MGSPLRRQLAGVEHAHAPGARLLVEDEVLQTPVAAASLRLALCGASEEERSVLAAILHVLSGRTARHWTLCDDTCAPDLRLATRASAATNDVLTALLLHEDEHAAAPEELALQAPLRVMAVLELLNAADDRLRQAALTQAVAEEPAHAHVHLDDGRSLAAALARLLEHRPDPTLRVRIVGHGTLYLCLKTHIHHCDFPVEHLAEALNEHRFVMTMLPAAAAELVVLRDSARPADEVLWQIGLVTPPGDGFPDTQAYRLKRWPDFARLTHRPEYIRLCAAMSRAPRRVATLAERSGLVRSEVEHVLHACKLCGWLDSTDASATPAAAVQAVAPRAASPLSGLFDRLRRRFGL